MPLEGRKRFKGVALGADAEAARLRLEDGTEMRLPARQHPPRQAGADGRTDRRHRGHATAKGELGTMALDVAIARPELLQVADAVAREKMIERDEVLEAMEQAIQKAGRAKYGHEKDIRAFIDRKDGEVKLSRWTEVVEQEPVENEDDADPAPHRPEDQARHRDRRVHHRPAAADRFRPHRRADRQAGDRAAGARGGAQASSTTSTRTASARSSTASSSAPSTAT